MECEQSNKQTQATLLAPPALATAGQEERGLGQREQQSMGLLTPTRDPGPKGSARDGHSPSTGLLLSLGNPRPWAPMPLHGRPLLPAPFHLPWELDVFLLAVSLLRRSRIPASKVAAPSSACLHHCDFGQTELELCLPIALHVVGNRLAVPQHVAEACHPRRRP